MRDLGIVLPDRIDAIAALGEALARRGVSIEGGGVFLVDGKRIAHFLFHDGSAARHALEEAGFAIASDREVLLQRLAQDRPGELGRLTRRMADAGVAIEVLYSDHDHQLVLVVDDPVRGAEVSARWTAERS
jgi:hypothetical protein